MNLSIPLQNHRLSETRWSGVNASFVLPMRSSGHRSICRCSGWRGKALWSDFVVGRTNKVFPWSKMSGPTAECTCCCVRDVLLQTKESWAEEVQVCSKMHCGCQSGCPQGGSYTDRYYCLSGWGPKDWQNLTAFPSFWRSWWCWPICCQNIKRVRGLSTNTRKIQHPATSCILQHRHRCTVLGKECTEENGPNAAEHLKPLAKRMKET